MEVTAYVLGMLTIILVAMLSVIVVGLLKIVKLNKQLNDLTLRLERDTDNIYRNMQSEHESFWRQFEACGRDVTMVEKTIMNQIDKTRKETDQAIDELHRIGAELNENAKRYTDSRIDKAIDTYFDMMGSKKLIKG